MASQNVAGNWVTGNRLSHPARSHPAEPSRYLRSYSYKLEVRDPYSVLPGETVTRLPGYPLTRPIGYPA